MPRTRPGQELNTINDSIRSMQGVLHGQPEPQDLADLVWSSLSQKHKAMVPGTVLAKAANYRDDSRQSFFFSVLSIQSLPALPAPIGRITSWKFEARGGGTWEITPYGTARMMDRIETELVFWMDPAASFPPPGSIAQARQLFNRLLAVDQHPEFIRLQPTMNNGQPVRPSERHPADLIEVVRSWKQGDGPSPQFIGITASPYNDALSYVDDGSSLWAVSYRYDHGQPFITDWEEATTAEMGESVNVARIRLCTLPVQLPPQSAVGGMGTTLNLTEMQSTNGQLLTRFFRLLALNNQGEVFSYFAPTIKKGDRLQWWQRYAAAASNLSLTDIKATLRRDGKIDVVFPSAAGEGQLLCSFPKPNQLRVEALRARSQTQVTRSSSAASQPVRWKNVADKLALMGIRNDHFLSAALVPFNGPTAKDEDEARRLFNLLHRIATDPSYATNIRLGKCQGPYGGYAVPTAELVVQFANGIYLPAQVDGRHKVYHYGITHSRKGERVLWVGCWSFNGYLFDAQDDLVDAIMLTENQSVFQRDYASFLQQFCSCTFEI